MSYAIDIDPQAEKFIFKLHQRDQQRIRTALDGLAENPRPHGCLKMKGEDNQWRLRVGRWRIVYSIWDKLLLVEVVDVDDRKDVYRD